MDGKTRNYILQFIDTHAGHVYSLSKVKHVNAQSLHERHMNILYTVCPGFQLGWNLLERLQEEHALCTMPGCRSGRGAESLVT